MKTTSFIITLLLFSWSAFAQAPFSIQLEPVNIAELGGVQSYAYGQHDGKWLIVGGRLDGLHRRQPWATFDVAGHNNQLIVIDPVALQKWSAPISALSTDLQEQLSSTNMEFHQEGNMLYILGGYGYSDTYDDHITYPKLTAIDVPATINAIINGTDFSTYIRQVTDEQFAVTGGHLHKIYDTYYLVGGQKFTGRYNPHGPDHGPGFEQEYTDAIRKFILEDDGTNIIITHLETITDTANLHRRDYNVVPQILPNGQEGLTAFSGVFQKVADIPYLNCVNIDSSSYVVNNDFSQYYNHYHCANLPLYSVSENEMHTVFFGGIAQYYDNGGVLVQDDEVPFVKTIARVTRTADGMMTEYKLPIEMPAYLGASSEMIPVEGLSRYANGVLDLDALTSDTTLVGYIYGGINSSAKNVFWINDGTQSEATSQIFKVYVTKQAAVGIDVLNTQSTGNLRMQMYPNPYSGVLNVDFYLAKQSDVELSVFDILGNVITKVTFKKEETVIGKNHFALELNEVQYGTILLINLAAGKDNIAQKLIINE